MERTRQIVEQIIRPTGLIDPEIVVRPAKNQVDDLLGEIRTEVGHGRRVLVTTLTKRMAESLTGYLKEMDIKVTYMHSDVDTLDRIEILRELRMGEHDVLVGINLLREGLDLPEVGASRDTGRGQGGLFALRNVADTDDRPRRAQRGRARNNVRRRGHRFHVPRDRARPTAAARYRWRTTRSTT